MKKRSVSAVLGGLAVSSAALIVGACVGPQPPATTYTPPSAVVAGNPWDAAQKLAATVPNSTLLVGHGDNLLPFYPEGTVLVTQHLQWEHLRAGMTVIYYTTPGNPLSLAGNVLVQSHGESWDAVGVKGGDPDNVRVEPTNYIGTVVAAFRTQNPSDPIKLLRSVPPAEAATCLMRCHIQ